MADRKPRRKRLGKLPPRYRFALNPYPEVRWSSCPRWVPADPDPREPA